MISDNYTNAIAEVREALGSFLIGDEAFKNKFRSGLVALIKNRRGMVKKYLYDYDALPISHKFQVLSEAMYLYKESFFLEEALNQVDLLAAHQIEEA